MNEAVIVARCFSVSIAISCLTTTYSVQLGVSMALTPPWWTNPLRCAVDSTWGWLFCVPWTYSCCIDNVSFLCQPDGCTLNMTLLLHSVFMLLRYWKQIFIERLATGGGGALASYPSSRGRPFRALYVVTSTALQEALFESQCMYIQCGIQFRIN